MQLIPDGGRRRANVEHRVAALVGGVVLAAGGTSEFVAMAHRHLPRIAVIVEIDRIQRLLVPRRDELHGKSNSGRGEHAVGPHDLRQASGSAVLGGLGGEIGVGDDS